MSQIKELHRDLLRFYLNAIRIEKSKLPIIGIREVENAETNQFKREYFVLTENRFGTVDTTSHDVQRTLIMTLCGERPGFYDGHSYNFYPDGGFSETYTPLSLEDKKNLENLLI